MEWNDEAEAEKPEKEAKTKKYAEESESSEDEKRKVKTKEEKLLDLIKEKYKILKNKVDSKIYVDIATNFDDIVKNLEKIVKQFGDNLPPQFLESLCLVEESLNLTKEDQRKLTSQNNTAFNNLKKSYVKNCKRFEEKLKAFKENRPSEKDLDKDEEKEEDEDQQEGDKTLSDISSELSLDLKKDEDKDPAERRLKWVKKPVEEKEKEKKKPPKDEEKPMKPEEKEKEGRGKKPKPEKIKAVIEKVEVITDEKIDGESDEIANQRGQSQRPIEIVGRLDYLLTRAESMLLKIKLLNLNILICFDTSPGQFSSLSLEMWNKIHDSILTLLKFYSELLPTTSQEAISTAQDDKNATNPPSSQKPPTSLLIASADVKQKLTFDYITGILQGSLVSILEKLELELYKSLQFTDQNSSEYIMRVRDELRFLLLCSQIEGFYSKFNDKGSISRVYLLIILHLYYKNEASIKKMIERFNFQVNRDEYLIKSIENPENFITQLCNTIYSHCDEKGKLKAMLCHVYFLCIHNRYRPARDLFTRSQIFEVIQIFRDDNLKILYNRTLAQLGLCAFRDGKYNDSLSYLSSLCSTGTSKLKEYLSQSYMKENEKSILFDKEDKKRVIPYIMTINIDEIESTYYLTLMVLELPHILLSKLGKRHKAFNVFFKKLLDNYEKQIFNGPPETNKERILCSSYSLIKGDWKTCTKTILSIKLYNHYKNHKEIKNIIINFIKETALKCYLIFYSNEFNSFKIESLMARFELEETQVKRIVNRQIIDREVEGKWNGKVLKIHSFENNERMIKHLIENLTTITNQNLDLMQIASSIKK